MDKVEQCVHDVAVIATAFGGHDLAEAKRRIEILFADADRETGGHVAAAQHLRDQLRSVLGNTSGPAGKRFLNDIIAWLQRDHLGR